MPPIAVGAGILGAATIGSSLLNRSSQRRAASAAEQQAQAAREQGALAQALFRETQPLRTESIDQLLATLTGEIPPLLLPSLTRGRETLEDQFSVAREGIINRTPARGGQLAQGLIDLESDRARALGGFEADIGRELFTQAQGAGFGQAPVALSGLGQATAGLGGSAATLANIQRGQAELLGSGVEGLGTLLGLKKAGSAGGSRGGSAGGSSFGPSIFSSARPPLLR